MSIKLMWDMLLKPRK